MRLVVLGAAVLAAGSAMADTAQTAAGETETRTRSVRRAAAGFELRLAKDTAVSVECGDLSLEACLLVAEPLLARLAPLAPASAPGGALAPKAEPVAARY